MARTYPNLDRLRRDVEWPVYGLGYIFLHLHGTIASIGKYDGSSRASRPAASGARTPE